MPNAYCLYTYILAVICVMFSFMHKNKYKDVFADRVYIYFFEK